MNFIYEGREPFCSVHGVGSVFADDRLCTGIAYMIECWQRAEGICRMTGLIDTDLRTAAYIRSALGNVLTLETGEEVAVVIVGNDSGFLEIEVQDPIKSCIVQSTLKQVEDVC